MKALKLRLLAVTGWRRAAALAGLGILAALALPPLYFLPLLFPAFTGLVWRVEGEKSAAQAFVSGWWFGFGLGAAGLSWIGFAFFVDAARFGWLAPFAIGGMAAGLAIFSGLTAFFAWLVFSKRDLNSFGRVLVFAALWVAMEWMRGWVLTGFPWNLMGTVWVVSDSMMQLAAITGVYGLSLLSVAVAAMPAVLAEENKRHSVIAIGLVLLVPAVVWGGGRIYLAGAGEKFVPGVRLRLVQPNIPQALKWRPELRRGHVEKQLKLSRMPPISGLSPTHIIWPETAVPFFLERTPGLTQALAAAVPPGGLIIFGAPRASLPGKTPYRIWNSLYAVDAKARVRATYDKFHLVPFGEYVPLKNFLPVKKLTAGRTDFSPGPGLATISVQGLPRFSPLICYEVIFPGRVAKKTNRPQWLLNLTNDAWFGRSSGPYQHFAASRLRAVEEGLPLVRVANTGISGVIDAYGRVVRRLDLGEDGVIDSPLPVERASQTVFSLLGHWMTLLILIMALGAGFLLTDCIRSEEK